MGYKPIPEYDFMSAPSNITVVGIGKEDKSEYHEESWDKKANKGRNFGIMIHGVLLCYHQTFMDQSYIKPTLCCFKKKEAWALVDMFMRLNYPFPYEVCEFTYDGFGGKTEKDVRMPYNARFCNWTGDPGIALMTCSDGEDRFIPTYAMKHSFLTLPNDMTRVEGSGHPTFFGAPSTSD